MHALAYVRYVRVIVLCTYYVESKLDYIYISTLLRMTGYRTEQFYACNRNESFASSTRCRLVKKKKKKSII